MPPIAAFALSLASVLAAPRPPSVLFVVIDDLGSADLGFHDSGIATPEIDRLAAEGTRLTGYYVQPSCSPTRSAFLSGRYPLHTGINNWIPDNATYGLPADDETLAQVMRRGGYRAHAVGKWHVGHGKWSLTPTFRGFESFFGFYQGGEGYFAHDSEGAYDLRRDEREYCGDGCSSVADERDNYSTHVFVREAIEVLERHRFETQPLFLYLAFQAVHGPDEVPDSYRAPYEGRGDWNDIRKTYAGMLSAADEGIANVTAALRRLNVEDDFLLVVTTDNGGPTETGWVQGSSNWPRRGGKCSIWEGGTAGDALLWGRGLGLRAGSASPHLFHAVDWLPTLAELAGVAPAGNPLDGVSQLTSLAGGPLSRTEIFYGVTDDEVGVQGPAVRVGRWKLIEGTGGDPGGWPLPGNTSIGPRRPTPPVASGFLLFDLENDPEERHELDLQAHAVVVAELQQRLSWYKNSGVPQAQNDPTCPLCLLGRDQPGCFIDDEAVGKAWKPWCSDANGHEDDGQPDIVANVFDTTLGVGVPGILCQLEIQCAAAEGTTCTPGTWSDVTNSTTQSESPYVGRADSFYTGGELRPGKHRLTFHVKEWFRGATEYSSRYDFFGNVVVPFVVGEDEKHRIIHIPLQISKMGYSITGDM